jgi:ketosteroid isomerase-like protein
MNRRDLLTIAALGSWTTVVAPSVRAGGTLPRDLEQAIEKYDRATVNNDVATLATVVADDYVLVNSDSSLQDKQSYLEDFKVPGFRLDPYELRDQVRKVWGDAALLAGVVRLSWTLQGERQARLLRIAHVWTRHDGRWRLAYTQLTRIPDAAVAR